MKRWKRVIRRAYNYNRTHVRGERVSAPLILLAHKRTGHTATVGVLRSPWILALKSGSLGGSSIIRESVFRRKENAFVPRRDLPSRFFAAEGVVLSGRPPPAPWMRRRRPVMTGARYFMRREASSSPPPPPSERVGASSLLGVLLNT
jgi:hypothetical protein